MTAYHRWLIKRRIFCEIGTCLAPATWVIKNARGVETVVCDKHTLPPAQTQQQPKLEKEQAQ